MKPVWEEHTESLGWYYLPAFISDGYGPSLLRTTRSNIESLGFWCNGKHYQYDMHISTLTLANRYCWEKHI